MTTKISVSLSDIAADQARQLASRGFAGNLSALIASLVEREARRVASLDAVSEWEAEHGELTQDELAAARSRWLG